jgi:hypothetical protein
MRTAHQRQAIDDIAVSVIVDFSDFDSVGMSRIDGSLNI